MDRITFGKEKPDVIYDYVGFPPQTWKWFWTGIFGKGYYALTKANRRHPQGKFKAWEQVHKELTANRCSIKPTVS